MKDQLLAYLLDDLSLAQRQRIEQQLETDPVWRDELERLRSCLANSSSEGHESNAPPCVCPPDDLVDRTCSLVRQAIDQNRVVPSQIVATPVSLTESCDSMSSTRRWPWADITIGAAVLLVVAALVFPALRESREAARRVTCQDNLRTLGTALAQYADQHGRELPHINQGENVGIFVVRLAEQGVLTRQQLVKVLVCPSTPLAEQVFQGYVVLEVPTQEQLDHASADQLRRLRENMSGNFAYRIGYVGSHGNYHHVKFVGSHDAPMLADTPSFEVAGFQSANHGGCGQNVLFQDLSVRYCKQCVTAEGHDHLFLNNNEQHQAGRSISDIVLVRGEYGRLGPLSVVGR